MNELVGQSQVTPVFDEQLYQSWLEYIDVKDVTARTYKSAIKNFISWLRDEGITSPARQDMLRYKKHLLEVRSASTAQLYIVAIRLLFDFLAQEGLYPNIAKRIKGVKGDSSFKRDYLTSDQARQLLGSIEGNNEQDCRDTAIISLCIISGLRTIEVSRADVTDLQKSGDSYILRVQGKGHDSKGDFVLISAKTHQAILAYLNGRGSGPLFVSTSNNSRGQRLTTRSISRIVKERLRGIDIDSPRHTAHSLRHSCATLNLLAGGTIQETQQILRHQSIATTTIYTQHIDKLSNKSSQRIEDFIFG
ncbi:MAG: site-specific integrase [Coriobacteriia bacterium]|nr:site-specific integrase [Coriobacteriia bacterium]